MLAFGLIQRFSIAQIRLAEQIAPVETLQPPYSLIVRDAEAEILPFSEREGIGVIVYSPMGSGMLTGAMTRERIARLPADDWRRSHPRFRDPELASNLALAEILARVGERRGASAGAVAVAWALRHPAVAGAIVGFRDQHQVEDIGLASELELSEHDLAEIAAATRPRRPSERRA